MRRLFKSKGNKFLIMTLGFLILMLNSCENDSTTGTEEPTPQVVVSDLTTVITDETRDDIVSIDTLSYTFIIDESSILVSDLEVGDILVDSISEKAPYGYLRKISSLKTTKDGDIEVLTDQATLPEAVNVGIIEFQSGKLSPDKISKIITPDGVKLNIDRDSKFTVFSMDYEMELEGTYGSVLVEGHTELELDFFFDFDWDWELLPIPHPYVELFESGVNVEQMGSIVCTSEGEAVLEERVVLAEFYFTPWTFMLGPVPVVFVPRIQLFVEMNGSITATMVASASENFHGRLGTRYTDEDGWEKISERTFETDYVAPLINASADFRTDLGPEVALLLYGIAGPFANITGFEDLEANYYGATNSWDMLLTVGVQTKVGAKIDVLGFGNEWSESFVLFEDTLIQLDNEPFGDDIFINTPFENQSFLVGDDIDITLTYTGETPDEVIFWIDYVEVFTDTEEPFEYTLNTEEFAEGGHIIAVNGMIAGEEISFDNVSVNLQIPVWETIDLEEFGLSESTNANDIFFVNTTKGYITVDGSTGIVLKTEDGGNNWNAVYSATALNAPKRVIMFNNIGEGIVVNHNNKVMYTEDDFVTLTEIKYEPYNQPSFQWKNMYDIAVNNDGEIVAVGKDTGIPYQYSVYRANIASHEPTGFFNLPYPNEYGTPPKIEMNGDRGILYDIYNEDELEKYYYMLTTDGGVSWQGFEFPMMTATDSKLYDAFLTGDNNIYLVGEENGSAIVMLSDNFGESWTKVELNGTPAFSSVQFIGEQEGYASAKYSTNESEPKTYHTTDGGHTWEPMIDSRSIHGMSRVYFLGIDFGIVSGKGPRILKYSVE